MPAMTMGPPPTGSYKFVARLVKQVRATGLDAQPIAVHTYAEVAHSRCVTFQGAVGHYIFFRTKDAHHRACCMGWEDVTAPWMDELKNATPEATTPGQRAIFAAMTTDWMSKREIVSRCSIPDSEWRTAIKTLMEKGIAECNFGPRQRKGASNRRYLYRRTAKEK